MIPPALNMKVSAVFRIAFVINVKSAEVIEVSI